MHDIWNPWHGCRKCSEGCQMGVYRVTFQKWVVKMQGFGIINAWQDLSFVGESIKTVFEGIDMGKSGLNCKCAEG